MINDLHTYDAFDGPVKPSHLCTTAPDTEPATHPIAGLLQLIETQSLSSDILLCCGDLGDKARPAGTQYAWNQVQRVKDKLRAGFLAATPGNHDVDSRYKYNDFDAKGVLQSLTPPYPLNDETLNDKFWARNFVLIDRVHYRLLILNSSAYHGGKEDEFLHGRIAQSTLQKIRSELVASKPRGINILVCHHHPHKHPDILGLDYSDMKGGSDLLSLLGTGEYGNWIVIHGHKHHPRVCYAAGSASSPIVFSAGSLSAVLYAELQTTARNQFYIIQFPFSRFNQLGFVGVFHAWDWAHGLGWLKARNGSGLPGVGGFGFRGDISILARSVALQVTANPKPFLNWDELKALLPELPFVLPTDLDLLIKKLRNEHSLHVIVNEDGVPVQLAK